MKNLIMLILCIGILTHADAQVSRIPASLYFLIGTWQGQGQYENGKIIEASITFKLALDSSWLLVQHMNKTQGSYKAVSLWGVDTRSGRFMAFTFDNYLGHRNFITNGWKKDKLILRFRESSPQRGQVYQYLVYEKISDDQFKMSYKISKGNHTWPLIDSIVFTKVN